jgi:hypothetical protein
MRAGRAIVSPTRWRGLSESLGFWNTIWTRRRCSRVRPPASGAKPANDFIMAAKTDELYQR